MNTVNMPNMAPMGGPVGAPMGMMNNGAAMAPQHVAPPRPQQADTAQTRMLLNTYIYEYFLKTNMADCAKAILKSDTQIKTMDHPNGRRDEHGNLLGNGIGDDPMDTDSKEDIDSKRIDELPPANLPNALNDSCFLLEWFSLFWDMLNAQKGKSANNTINQFVSHAQQQSRMRQNQQQDILRQIRPDGFAGNQPYQMMRNMQNGNMMNNMKQANHLPRTAMANSQNNPQAMQMLQQKQAGQMSRDPSDMDGNRPRPASPGSADNAPSPSKRPRLDGGPFNPAQAGMMANGRPVGQGMPGQQVGAGPINPQQAQQLLMEHGVDPAAMNPDRLQTFTNQSPSVQQKTIQTYAQNLSHHHNQHMPNKPMPNTSGPQAQGSPMVPQGPDGGIGAFYNAEMGGPGGMRPGPGGNQAAGGSNHALQDYQMQLMLLEQQNKKRLMMARQEQDGIGMGRDGGPGGPGGPGAPPGPNAPPFQGTSPPGGRTGASPNPAEQMKRNAQQMGSGGMGSPIPEGQNRGSPNPVNFMGGNMDPNMAPNFFKGMPGADGNMVAAAQMNGMRPPSSHPAQHFNGQMNQQQMMAARQQQQAQAANGPQMQWQGGPNGNPMGGPQGPQGQPVQGTPQQRSMPPPSAPAVANANQRNQTASPQVANAAPPTPQQSTKANPKKKDTKNSKGKAATQKKSATNLNSGATPAAEVAAEPEPPTPATPITPVNPQSFTKPGQGGVMPNGQAPAPAAPAVPPPSHSDPVQNGNFMDGGGIDFVTGLDFANPMTSDNVLTDFDFDSFLHDGDQDAGFDFSAGGFGMEGAEIGTE